MSVQHFTPLLFKSARIQQEIDREQRRRWPAWIRLIKLKKLRLIIKDHMSRLLINEVEDGLHLQKVKVTVSRNHRYQR